MEMASWLASSGRRLKELSAAKSRRRGVARLRQRSPCVVETLEDRCLLTDGDLDPSFGVGGKVLTSFGISGTDIAECVAIQSDGKIVVAGHRESSSGDFDFAVARYNSDGTFDTSFGGSGEVTTRFAKRIAEATSVAL